MKFKNFESSPKTKWIAKYVLYRRDSIYSNKMISFFRFIFVSWTTLSCDPLCDRVKAQPLALLRAGASSAPSFFSAKPPPPRVGHANASAQPTSSSHPFQPRHCLWLWQRPRCLPPPSRPPPPPHILHPIGRQPLATPNPKLGTLPLSPPPALIHRLTMRRRPHRRLASVGLRHRQTQTSHSTRRAPSLRQLSSWTPLAEEDEGVIGPGHWRTGRALR
jgi:hypothetical protein